MGVYDSRCAFLSPAGSLLQGKLCYPFPQRRQSVASSIYASDTRQRDDDVPLPEFNIQPAPGRTGVLASNLWPLPILGSYGWILTSWRTRGEQHKVHVNAHISAWADRVSLSFSGRDVPISASRISGIVTGDYNVVDTLKKRAAVDYCLSFLDETKTNTFSLQTFVTTGTDMPAPPDKQHASGFWSSRSLLYTCDVKACSSDSIEIRLVYEDIFFQSRRPRSKFQYFALNCSPLPFPQYTALIAVYRQHEGEKYSVCLDSRHRHLQYAFVKWAEAGKDTVRNVSPLSKIAVAKFSGACSDAKVTHLHQDLLRRVQVAGLQPKDCRSFRIFMSNAPRVSMFSRENELVVELE